MYPKAEVVSKSKIHEIPRHNEMMCHGNPVHRKKTVSIAEKVIRSRIKR